MCCRIERRPIRPLAAAFLLVAAVACSGGTVTDPHNRDVPWAYGPITGTSTAEHARGTGSEGGAAIAKGWQCRLADGKHLTVRPYQLARSHPLFDKVTLSVGLFDQTGKQLAMLNSPVITAANATFTFDIAEATADQLWDLVLWYRKA